MNKRPRHRKSFNGNKSPRHDQKKFHETFTWRTDYIDMNGSWGWEQASISDILKRIIPALHLTESLTWEEIVGNARGHHFIGIESVCAEAQQRFSQVWSEDVPDK